MLMAGRNELTLESLNAHRLCVRLEYWQRRPPGY